MAQKSKNLMIGKWLPTDRKIILTWMRNMLEKQKKENLKQYKAIREYFPEAHTVDEELRAFVEKSLLIRTIKHETNLHESILTLIEAIGKEPDVGMLIIEMFRQQEEQLAPNLIDAIFLMNSLLTAAPRFSESLGIAIPLPFGALLTYVMATPAGFAAFLKSRVNELFKGILLEYQSYLLTQKSCNVLVDNIPGGWFTEPALEVMPDFKETFVCNPLKPHWGFTSFDDFFTRRLRETARPTANPDDVHTIVNACENAPYQISYCVNRCDAFWIKSQPYSLEYILNGVDVDRFVGGTIYQGFLSPHTYHRFHAPVSGKVVRAEVVNGTFFSQPYKTDSKANYMTSQPYLAHVATRGIIVIDTGKTTIGHVALIPIGMVDVSSVDLLGLQPGQQVKKGDNIGTFHFGGSSHLLIFEKGVQLAFDLQGIKPDPLGNEFLNVRSRIATVVKD